MNANIQKYGFLALKLLVGGAFAAAGVAKLVGVEMMVQTFETVGVGQWFRYVTGVIELGSAFLLFVPGMRAIGAGLLVCTMIGAVLAHIFILGPSFVPAAILGVLSAIILYLHRDELPMMKKS